MTSSWALVGVVIKSKVGESGTLVIAAVTALDPVLVPYELSLVTVTEIVAPTSDEVAT